MQLGISILFLLVASTTAAENACPPTEVVKFAELYANPHLHPCQKTSAGFSMVPPTGYPTEPQVKAMCSSDACRALIKDVLALKPDDCYLSFAGVKLNAYKLARSFEDDCKTGNNHENGKYEPTPKPTDDNHHPTPKPTEDDTNYSTPKPAEDDKYYLTPKPTDHKHYPTPKPTDDNHYHTAKPTEEIKHYPTTSPTNGKYDPTPKPTEGKYYPTPHPMKKDPYKLNEPKIIKVDNEETSCPKHSNNKETAKEADVKPPMHGTAEELFPMPNTTYKATEPKTSLKA